MHGGGLFDAWLAALLGSIFVTPFAATKKAYGLV